MVKHERPNGVTIITMLMFLSSLLIGFYAFLQMAMFVVGGEGNAEGGGYDWVWIITQYDPLILMSFLVALFAFCLSIALFNSNSRHLWYVCFIFWIVSSLLFVPLTTSIWKENSSGEFAGFQNLASWQIEQLIVTLLPYIHAMGCSLYFLLSKNVKGYFRV